MELNRQQQQQQGIAEDNNNMVVTSRDEVPSLKKYTQVENLPVIETLDDLIRELNAVFKGNDHLTEDEIEIVEYLMKSYKSDPSHWKKYAKFDRYKYTRNLVDAGNNRFNLMALCWGEGHGSAIHDHANAHCFMKILQGSLEEVRFAWPSNEEEALRETGRKKLLLNNVCYMSDKLGLHRVENTSHSDPAVSLHLYCPPYNSCSVFDQKTGQKSKCNVTFWSEYGIRRNKDEQDQREPEDN